MRSQQNARSPPHVTALRYNQGVLVLECTEPKGESMFSTRCAAVALTTAFALNCGDGGPTDPEEVLSEDLGPSAAVTVNEREVPFTLVTHHCSETQYWTGTDHWIEQLTETPSGRVMIAFRSNYRATVVGQPSGRQYTLAGHFEARETFDAIDGYPYVINGPETDVLVGHGNTPNMISHWTWIITTNANGDVTVARVSHWAKCQ